jgi:anaerobic selenocysteine-containing dehydrogenase
MVSIDFYVNETTRFANLILPPTSPLENDHYPLLEYNMSIRNFAHYTPAMFEKPAGAKHNWEIMLDLLYSVEKHSGAAPAAIGWIKRKALYWLSPLRQLNLLLKFGPHKLSIEKLLAARHGIDLGPLEPRLDKILSTPDRKIHLVPEKLVPDLSRLEKRMSEWEQAAPAEFLLVSRRELRSNNSWLHNSLRLVKGSRICTLIMNKSDAERLGIANGEPARMFTKIGEISVPAEITEDIMPGVVSMNFGWGHNVEGVRLRVARAHAGVNVNEITDEKHLDAFSGISMLDGIPVKVTKP